MRISTAAAETFPRDLPLCPGFTVFNTAPIPGGGRLYPEHPAICKA